MEIVTVFEERQRAGLLYDEWVTFIVVAYYVHGLSHLIVDCSVSDYSDSALLNVRQFRCL